MYPYQRTPMGNPYISPILCNPMYLIDQRFSHVSFDFQEHLQSTFFCIIESLHISASEFGENVWSQSCGLTSAGFCRHAAALGAPCVCHFWPTFGASAGESRHTSCHVRGMPGHTASTLHWILFHQTGWQTVTKDKHVALTFSPL